MINKVKKLRVDIDGISQLVRELSPKQRYIIDIAYIPQSHGIDLEKFIYYFEKVGYALVNSKEEHGQEDYPDFNIKQAVQVLPVNNKEIEKCYDSLILAKAWLGKVLGELGEETPYKNDGNRKTVEDIEPTTDINTVKTKIEGLPIIERKLYDYIKEKNTPYNTFNHIEKVDWLREEINKLIFKIHPLDFKEYNSNKEEITIDNLRFGGLYLQQAILELNISRFWLGFELQRIKEENDGY